MAWKDLKAALVVYDLGASALAEMTRDAATNADIDRWVEASAAAIEKLHLAFFADCVAQGVPNSLDHCRVTTVSWLRELAAKP